MPKSKRAKVVPLTKVKKKDREWKSAIIDKVRNYCDQYNCIYVFKYYNMRNDRFKELREDLKDSSKIMMASTKKLQAALGREQEEECRPDVHKLCPYLRGHAALLFTNLPHQEVQETFEDFFHEDYARAGASATRTVILPQGPVEGPGGLPFPHTMEHTLRGHGLPTKLHKGVIELIAEHTLCEEGKALSPDQAALLRHFHIKMATFRLKLKARISGKDEDSAKFEELDGGESDIDGGDGADDLEPDAMYEDGLPESMMLPAAVTAS